MNILMITQYYYQEDEKDLIEKCNGNISVAHHKLVDNLYRSLNMNNYKVDFLSTIPVGNFPRKCHCLSFRSNYRERGYEIGFINLPFIKHICRKSHVKNYVKNWLKDKKNEKNIILIYDLYLPFFNALIKKEKRSDVIIIPIIPDVPGPLCVEYKTYNQITKIYKTWQYKKIKHKLKFVDANIVLTKYMPEVLEIEMKKNIVIEGMIEDQFQAKENIINQHDKINVLYAGELSKTVGIDILLKAFSYKDIDQKYVLHICGKGDAEEDIKRLNKENIIYHGFLNKREMNELEQIIDIYVNPRTNVGEYTKYSFPSKNLEYLKTGKPVIAFKLDGIPEEYDEYLNYPDNETAEGIKNKIIEVSKWNKKTYSDKMEKQLDFVDKKTVSSQGKKIISFLEDIENEVFNPKY